MSNRVGGVSWSGAPNGKSGVSTRSKCDCGRSYKMEWARKKKVKLIMLNGGKCKECPLTYNGKNGGLFQFHHRNPKLKKIGLNLHSILNIKWSSILKELKKCNLLCGNCHLLKNSKEF